MRVGFWEFDLIKRQLIWSKGVFDIFGQDSSRFEPGYDAFVDLVHPDDRDQVLSVYDNAVSEGVGYKITHRIILPDGQIKWVLEHFETQYASDGTPIRSLGMVSDISELQAPFNASWRSEKTLDAILAIAPLSILLTDASGIIQLSSKGSEDTFGYTQSELIGKSILELMPARSRHKHPNHFSRFIGAPEVSRDLRSQTNIFGLRKNGEEFPVEASVSKVKGEHGLIMCFILRDVTQRLQQEKALTDAKRRAEAASEAKSNFLAMMSHEIRTPLNAILGMVEVLRRDNGDDIHAQRLNIIEEAGETLTRIIDDILDLTKIEAGHLDIIDIPFDLADLMSSVSAHYDLKCQEKGLSYTMRIAEGSQTSLCGDVTRLRQILGNLISNAVKFTKEGGITVDISATYSARDGYVDIRFSVDDTGPGIPEEFADQLFTPFTRGDFEMTSNVSGTGLGLSISRQLCQLMQGDLQLADKDGPGCRFEGHVCMSRYQSRTDGTDHSFSATSAGLASATEPLRILLAEDNLHNQEVVLSLLEPLEADIIVVDNGEAAVNIWRQERFDLILMDIRMPVMNGVDASREIRRIETQESRPRTPILALTANAMTEQIKTYESIGIDACIAKPIRVKDLYARIAQSVAG